MLHVVAIRGIYAEPRYPASDAIAQGKLNKDTLFAERYEQISGTNPAKYHRAYDRFTDQHLPGIQKPILARQPYSDYAVANL